MLFTVAWCFNTRFLESYNMHGLEIRMCVFNHINISIFTIRAGVFTRFKAYRVTSVNPPPPPRVKKTNITYSILCHYFWCHQNIASWTEKTKQKFIMYRKVKILSNMKENIHVDNINKPVLRQVDIPLRIYYLW